MPRVLVIGREIRGIALQSLHVPRMLVHHERPPTDLLSTLSTPALPQQRRVAMCSPQSCRRRSCSEAYCKWHMSLLAALARAVLESRPVHRHLYPTVLLLSSSAHRYPNPGRRVVAVRHVRLSDASAGAGRAVLAIGVAAGGLHDRICRGSVGWIAQYREAGFDGGEGNPSGAIHATVCFVNVGRSIVQVSSLVSYSRTKQGNKPPSPLRVTRSKSMHMRRSEYTAVRCCHLGGRLFSQASHPPLPSGDVGSERLPHGHTCRGSHHDQPAVVRY
jgi:hypothetical protein